MAGCENGATCCGDLARLHGTELTCAKWRDGKSARRSRPSDRRLKAAYDGRDLEAATAFEAHERVAVERFCRYGVRGPLALNRLAQARRTRCSTR